VRQLTLLLLLLLQHKSLWSHSKCLLRVMALWW
jgi:hypothetical protein